MNCLAVDTSGNHLTVLLLRGEETLQSFSVDVSLKHSVTLMPEIENLLEKSNISLSDIDVFCAVIGPGSFTGIRIGVSTVKALAYSVNKKVLPVTSFEVLAYNVNGGKVLSVIDARHGNYYACGYDGKNVSLNPCFIDFERLENLSKEYSIVSDTKLELPCVVANLEQGLTNAVKDKLPLASSDIESLIPLYVKKSQAEEECK